MTGEIDTTYQTMQRDLFAGGLAAKIGANAFAVWSAIKYHADFESGHAWPSIRRLAEMTGIGKTSVMRAVATLEAEHMLRKAATGWPSNPSKGGRGHSHTYIACERLDVRLGARVICTIVIDYVPGDWLVESKSLKLYLSSFRNHGAFHEDCTVAVGKRLRDLLAPRWLRIGGYWYPRGGIPIDVFWQTGRPPAGAWIPDQGVAPYRGRG